MSALLDIRNLLQDTGATLEQLERAIARDPHDWSLAVTAESLKQRYTDLERTFAETAHSDLLDVCDYRLIPESESSSIASVTKALSSFQEMLTVVFDAMKNGPKIRARLSPEIVAGSTLDFGYAYAGSLGFVLTMPIELVLIGESDLERAMRAVFEMAKAETPQQLAAYVPQVGVAGIRRLYAWSSAHADYGLSADIKWNRLDEERGRVLVQKEELSRLRGIIAQASEEKSEGFEMTGELMGLDVSGGGFRLSVPGGDEVTGKVADSFDRGATYQIHGRYSAKLLKKSKIYYSQEREEEWWELLELVH